MCYRSLVDGLTALLVSLSILSALPVAAELTADEKVMVNDPATVSSTLTADVTVHESLTIRPANRELLGCQFEYGGQDRIMAAKGNTDFASDFAQIAKDLYKLPIARTSGIPSQHLNWFNNIGPMQDRKPSPENTTPPKSYPAQNFGPIEWIKAVQMINPNCEYIVCLNLNNETAEENAQYAEFLMAPAATSKWGALRAKYGVPNPVKVVAFELGNERDGLITPQEKLDTYIARAKESITAIRKVVPTAKFIACGKTAPWEYKGSAAWGFWTRGVAKALGPDIDYMSFHPYYCGISLPDQEKYFDQIRADLHDVLGADRVKFIVTEHAKWPNNPGKTFDSVGLDGCLCTAEFLNRMYHHSDVWAATYHCFAEPIPWWTMVDRLGGKLLMMGMPRMYKAYESGLGDRVVQSTVQSASKLALAQNSECKFTVLATAAGKRGLNLILVNRSPDAAYNLHFNFEQHYQLMSETVFTAPNMNSYVSSPATENVFSTVTTDKKVANFTQYTMPNKSLVILHLQATSDIRNGLDFSSGSGITVNAGQYVVQGKTLRVAKTTYLPVKPLETVVTTNEPLRLSTEAPSSYGHGTRLMGTIYQGNMTRGAFNAASLVIRRSPDSEPLVEGKDYLVSSEFGRVGLGPESKVTANDTVYASYTCSHMRIDALDINAQGKVVLRQGTPSMTLPLPPAPVAGWYRLANIFRPYWSTAVTPDDLYPVSETAAQAKTLTTPRRIPKTLAKLRAGQPVTIVCWGDSVTEGGNASTPAKRYVNVFADGLRQRFPKANINVLNISVGGSNSGQWLYPDKNPPEPNQKGIDFQRIVDAHPDLVTVEFVNDSWCSPEETERRYTEMLKRFAAINAEVILITPHYMNLRIMNFTSMRDPESRQYVFALRKFAETNHVALADAGTRWEHLWKEGIPYMTLMANGINHPDDRGHLLFAEELWKCFAD